MNLHALKIFKFIKKRVLHRFFPVNIAKFLRTLILKNICERLLLDVDKANNIPFGFVLKKSVPQIIIFSFFSLLVLFSFLFVRLFVFYVGCTHSSFVNSISLTIYLFNYLQEAFVISGKNKKILETAIIGKSIISEI